jgi:hypothetical protein
MSEGGNEQGALLEDADVRKTTTNKKKHKDHSSNDSILKRYENQK